jgi:hypothetical protein
MQDTNDNRLAHLGMIQGVINRMAGTSFILKGWSVTLVAAMSALAADNSRQAFAYLALLPALVFWGLDAYYLRQERLFRKVYDAVRTAEQGSLGDTFSMDTSSYRNKVPPFLVTLAAPILAVFHGALVLAVAALIVVVSK